MVRTRSQRPRYDYTQCPLFDPPRRSCRVLHLLPGRFHDDIYVRLSMTYLDDEGALSFDALSYVWGSQADPAKAYVVDDETCLAADTLDTTLPFLSITRNLEVALRHLRPPDTSRTVWIDAICINQAVLAERGQQVQLMPLIYRRAASVTVWLGPAADGSGLAFSVLRRWASKVAYDFAAEEPRLLEGGERDAWMADKHSNVLRCASEMRAVNALIERAWFERAWVKQEVSLSARNATVQCGYDAMPWLDFQSAVCCYGLREDRAADVHADYERFERAWVIRTLVDPEPAGFVSLLDAGRRLKCLDPRDKVYSILGLIEDAEAYVVDAIKPDYFRSYDELRSLIFVMVAQKRRSLNMLTYCGLTASLTVSPSWAPDWTDQLNYNPPFLAQNADAGVDAPLVHVDDGALHVKGVVCAQIQGVRHWPFSTEDMGVFAAADAMAVLKAFCGEVKTHLSEADTTEVVEVIARTMIGADNQWRKATQEELDTLTTELSTALTSLLCLDWKSLGNVFGESDGVRGAEHGLSGRACDPLVNSCVPFLDRSIAFTSRNLISLTSHNVEPGDVLMVLLGLSSTAVLRPRTDGSYSFVSTAYTDGLEHGEALLGPLNPDWQWAKRYKSARTWHAGFEGKVSGAFTVLDPRVDWAALQVEASDPRCDEALSADAQFCVRMPDEGYLLSRRIKVETIRIV